MIINAETLQALDTGVKKIYNDALKNTKESYKEYATVVKTKNHSVTYGWLEDFPSMKEWISNRDLKDLTAHTYAIAKKDWEASVTITRDDILFDNLGLVTPRVQSLAHTVNQHYNKYIGSLITVNDTCYDGKPFFATDHAVGGNTVSNTGDAVLSSQTLMNTYSKMLNLKNENNEPYDIEPTMLYIAPNLLSVAMTILNSDQIDSSSNITKNLVAFKVIPTMADNSWCLVDNSKPIKPFVIQITREAKIEKDETDMFKAKKMHYGVDTMDNAGYTFWQLAQFNDGTATE